MCKIELETFFPHPALCPSTGGCSTVTIIITPMLNQPLVPVRLTWGSASIHSVLMPKPPAGSGLSLPLALLHSGSQTSTQAWSHHCLIPPRASSCFLRRPMDSPGIYTPFHLCPLHLGLPSTRGWRPGTQTWIRDNLLLVSRFQHAK